MAGSLLSSDQGRPPRESSDLPCDYGKDVAYTKTCGKRMLPKHCRTKANELGVVEVDECQHGSRGHWLVTR